MRTWIEDLKRSSELAIAAKARHDAAQVEQRENAARAKAFEVEKDRALAAAKRYAERPAGRVKLAVDRWFAEYSMIENGHFSIPELRALLRLGADVPTRAICNELLSRGWTRGLTAAGATVFSPAVVPNMSVGGRLDAWLHKNCVWRVNYYSLENIALHLLADGFGPVSPESLRAALTGRGWRRGVRLDQDMRRRQWFAPQAAVFAESVAPTVFRFE